MMPTSEQIVVAELLKETRRRIALCRDREPELSNLLRQQIRLEDRAHRLAQ